MTPDLNTVIENRHSVLRMWWKRGEYIRERKAFVKRNPFCSRCGRPTRTPGHAHEDYRDYETYLAAVKTDKCEPLCSACNLMESKGKKPCPVCIKQKKDQIRYIGQDQECCFYCVPEEVKEARQKRSHEFKKFVRTMLDSDNARRRTAYQERRKVKA